MDPEYFLSRKLTEKSDVYSLGVVFLELLTGMQPIFEGKHIVREVLTLSMPFQEWQILDIIILFTTSFIDPYIYINVTSC